MPRPQLVLFLSGLLPLLASSFAPRATPAIFAQSRRGTFVEAPRSVRSRTVDQQHLKLDIRVDLERQEAHATAHWTFSPFQPVRSLTLDAAEMQIKQVTLVVSPPQPGSRALGYRRSGGSLEIDLDREYAVGEPFTLAI